MGRVIYAKYSTERRQAYWIITKITEEQGKRHVIKEAVHEKSLAHVQAISGNYPKLKSYYKDGALVVVPCQKYQDKSVEFEYIEGESYDVRLQKLIREKNYEKLRTELVHLKDMLENVESLVPFQISDDFREVFGEVDEAVLTGKKAYTLSNIDLIFDNILCRDGKFYITDYEWVFPFAVPVNYVLYRSVLLCGVISVMPQEEKEKIYQCLAITDEEIKIYHKMEISFQKYVSGKNLFDAYKTASKNCLYYLEDVPKNQAGRYVDIYVTNKEGKEQFVCREQYVGTQPQLSVQQISGAEQVILRLGCRGAVFKILSVQAVIGTEQIELSDYEVNADLVIGQDYYVKGNAPQIIIANHDYDELRIEISLLYENSTLIDRYVEKILDSAEAEKKWHEAERKLLLREGDIAFKDKMIEEQGQVIEERTKQLFQMHDEKENAQRELAAARGRLERIEATIFWRAYAKLKSLKGKSDK